MSDKLLVLEEFFAQKIWFLELGMGIRVHGCSIKVEPQGYLLVIRARSAEGPKVAFVGKSTLDGLRRHLLGLDGTDTLKWRDDQFALDRMQT